MATGVRVLTLDACEHASLSDIINHAKHLGSYGAGVFGLRLQRHSFDFWIDQLGVLYPEQKTDLGRIEAVFGRTRFIYLTRPNKVAQAVSLARANQSGLWNRNADGSERERLATSKPLRYNAVKIETALAELTRHEASWQNWFAQEAIKPLHITYDALAADPVSVVKASDL